MKTVTGQEGLAVILGAIDESLALEQAALSPQGKSLTLPELRKLGWIGTHEQWRQYCEFETAMPPEKRRESQERLIKLLDDIEQVITKAKERTDRNRPEGEL